MNTRFNITAAVAALVSSVALLSHAGAPAPLVEAPPSSALEQYFMQDYMLGDWGGLRTRLAENGVDFEFFYVGSMPTNLGGGIRAGSAYQHGFLAAMDLDTEKLGWWNGGHFHVSGVSLEGRPFADTYVGDLNKTNLVDFPADTRLWQAYYQQDLFNDKLIIKAGLMSVDRDFILPELYNSLASINFMNQTFFFPTMAFNLYDIPGFPEGSHSLPSTPYAALGALVKWQPVESFYIQAAIYDGNPDASSSGTRLALRAEEGALMYFETGFRLNQGKDDRGLPGNYKLGGYYHTDEFYDINSTILSMTPLPLDTAETHKGNYGVYLLAEQMLWRESGRDDPAQQGIVGFFRVAGAPSDRNLAEFGIDGGLVFKGLIPGRDYDTLGIGGSYLKISEEVSDAQRRINEFFTAAPFNAPAIEEADYEAVVEVNYKLQLAAWWTLQASLQYVFHPGGRAGAALAGDSTPDALVLGIQTTLRF
ncbi:OprB family porin [Prosthecobacter fusiformis]|uniref:OprB family porin n=1 Tax=Prosthecobacter fusiformis TaxID=48464 RepID=A0A4R7RXL3_9BACT|nr:carbohydrate porin [Prosthecobacter fusiformis]TDU70612.1 OprB family porin [Prosthecobacter fusiformis]